ncbi:MAG: class F sortase [Actinomycetota bacterium]|nr:class F sortase [Actinomycetota bacterium]
MKRTWPVAVAVVALIAASVAGTIWLLAPPAPAPRAAAPVDREEPSRPGGDQDGADGDQRPARGEPRTRLASEQTAEGEGLFRIRIAAIGVEAPVIRLGLTDDERLEVPARTDQAGWWSGGEFPGHKGPAVIVGHVDSSTGPAVFFGLRELEPGDVVEVTPRGRRTVRFVVDRLEDVPKDGFPTRAVYGPTPGSTLRLVTCSGTFDESSGHYRDNLVVFARRQ